MPKLKVLKSSTGRKTVPRGWVKAKFNKDGTINVQVPRAKRGKPTSNPKKTKKRKSSNTTRKGPKPGSKAWVEKMARARKRAASKRR